MSYQIELIRQNEQTSSTWSGGTTTQIAIYPKDALYAERNFIWRLSSASVELAESDFTPLPGIWRLIMVLEGEMRLEHTGHHTKHLKPFDQDSFSGDWSTKSFGKVRDFNLMMATGCTGELTAVCLEEKTSSLIDVAAAGFGHYAGTTAAFYCVDGKLSLTANNQNKYVLNAGDLLLLTLTGKTDTLPVNLTAVSTGPARFIRADIKCR